MKKNGKLGYGTTGLASVMLFLLLFVSPGNTTLTCEVRAAGCQTGYATLFKLSNATDAHAELVNESLYNVTVCCRETYGVNASLGTGCSGTYNKTILNISGNTNAHAALNNETGYDVRLCINSTMNITFGYDTTCGGYDTCIASVSGNRDAHVGNCTAYSTLLCVQTRNMTVNRTEGNGATIATRGYQTQNLTVTFYDAARGIYPSAVAGRIFISNNGTYKTYDCTSNSNGNCTVKFDPDCTFVGGKASWRGGVFNDASYNNMNSTDGEITIDIEAACLQTVSFQLEFNIAGSGSDAAEVDGLGTGFYRSNDTTNYYGCIQDTSIAGTPTFGLAFSGSELDYINLTSGDSFRIRMSQFQSNNKFIIPVTQNGCDAVRNKMPLIQKHGLLTQPFVTFVTTQKNPIDITLSYSDLDIIGNLSKSGIFTVTLEKNETAQLTQIIVRE
ncbi:MAG: hypothetical protein HYT72_05720 [Candidatus Aenigmarchaeota archaeon]|nr:hypothetical protein [Candidatus Aenigmarchaeota archaeon]